MADPHWSTYFSLITPFAAAAAAYTAYKFGAVQASIARQQATTAALQAETAKTRLRLDLFERRAAIYDIVAEYLKNVVNSAGLDLGGEVGSKFLIDVHPIRWLFGPEVEHFVNGELRRQMGDLMTAKLNLDGVPAGPERVNQLIDLSSKQMALMLRHEDLARLFDPYLRFKE